MKLQGFGVKIQKNIWVATSQKNATNVKSPPKKTCLVKERVLRFWIPFLGRQALIMFHRSPDLNVEHKHTRLVFGFWTRTTESYSVTVVTGCPPVRPTTSHLVLHGFFDDLLWMVNL